MSDIQEAQISRKGRVPTDVRGLYLDSASGIYYARFKVKGVGKWQSLRTKDKGEAVKLLVERLPKMRAAAERTVMEQDAKQWESDQKFSPTLIGYWCRCETGEPGVVVSDLTAGAYLIRLVNAERAQPTAFRVAVVDQMKDWRFYRNREEMEKAAKR